MNYKVKIKYFADKIYTNTDIQTILHEIAIFTDIENIISIIKVWQNVSDTMTQCNTYKVKISIKQITYFYNVNTNEFG